jgi:hypothetical protein
MSKRRKSPDAVAHGRKGGIARRNNLTPEQRIASARYAALSRYGKAPAKPKWYGLFDFDLPSEPQHLILYSRDKDVLRQRAKAEPERIFIIEDLDYDPETRMQIVPKFEPDTAARLKALQDLQQLDAELGKEGRS